MDRILFSVSSHDKRGDGTLWGFFYKSTNHFPKGLPPDTIMLAIRISIHEFWDTHIQSIVGTIKKDLTFVPLHHWIEKIKWLEWNTCGVIS